MKPKKIIIIASCIVAVFAIWFFFLRNKEKPVVLTTEQPFTGPISTSVTATGTVQPVDTVTVGTQVSGTISALYADYNSNVKKGELLAELDKTLIQSTVDQSKANLVQAQSNENYQKANFDRQQQLFQTGSISKADFDLSLNTYQVAKASVNNVKAQLRAAERNLSFTQIYSPIDGVVLSRSVNIGQTVAASFSTPTLFTIAKDITKMQVQAKVDEADIGNVRKEQRSTFTVDAFIDDTFNGTVKDIRLQPAISSNVVTYATLIDAPNNDKKLKPGMTANIVIYTKEEKDALLISAQALKFNPDSTLLKNYQIIPNPERRKSGKGNRSGRNHAGNSAGANGNATGPATAQTGENGAQTGRTRNQMGKAEQPATDKTTKSADVVSIPEAYVWVLQGQKLIQKKIKTGLNDNTHVQVLEGLTANDLVVTAMETNGAPGATAAASSPFMPKRTGGGRR